MFFLPQSVARLPPIGFSYLERLGFLVRAFPCKISIFQTAKRNDRFSTVYGHIIGYIFPFVYNARNFAGKDGMARDNAIRLWTIQKSGKIALAFRSMACRFVHRPLHNLPYCLI